ncbi:MAG TPA: hypothetical protein PLZ36_10290 [Armatimonadota bacterium]|mgnify:CR=1 FL=1|nr:hypothetical protein [Armatimonadota bacterium]HOS43116.1 hypothetical protein [Armatimonadota bacterium]
MVFRFYGISTVSAGALLAGVLLGGMAAPASAKGPARQQPVKIGVTHTVVRPGISIVLKKKTVQPVKARKDVRPHGCRTCDKGWRNGHQRDGWCGKHERRDSHRRDDHRRNGRRDGGCRH